jgi:hypothetical protein
MPAVGAAGRENRRGVSAGTRTPRNQRAGVADAPKRATACERAACRGKANQNHPTGGQQARVLMVWSGDGHQQEEDMQRSMPRQRASAGSHRVRG